jgi:hypothetical protein
LTTSSGDAPMMPRNQAVEVVERRAVQLGLRHLFRHVVDHRCAVGVLRLMVEDAADVLIGDAGPATGVSA